MSVISALSDLSNHIIPWLLTYRYEIIIPLAILEGPILAMICGFLLKLGALDLLPVFLCLMLGDICSDVYWYYLGYYGGRPFLLKFGRFFGINEKTLKLVEKLYHRHYALILFLSKLTMGFGFAVQIVAVAGMVKIPFKKYMAVNLLGQPIWTAILLSIGYFLGTFYETVNKGLEWVFFGATIVIIIFLVIGIMSYVRNVLVEKYL